VGVRHKSPARPRKASQHRWSNRVTETSDALDLERAKGELRELFYRPRRES